MNALPKWTIASLIWWDECKISSRSLSMDSLYNLSRQAVAIDRHVPQRIAANNGPRSTYRTNVFSLQMPLRWTRYTMYCVRECPSINGHYNTSLLLSLTTCIGRYLAQTIVADNIHLWISPLVGCRGNRLLLDAFYDRENTVPRKMFLFDGPR